MLDTIHDGIEERRLGCLPREAKVGSLCTVFSDKFDLIPESQWKPISLLHLVPDIYDQDGIGMCNACAGVGALQVARVISGQQHVLLSPGDLYHRIALGGRDQGSLLSDAVKALHTDGVATAATVPVLDWRNSVAKARDERQLYKIDEWYDCPSFAEIASSLQRGFPVDFGTMVGGDSFTPDAQGFVRSLPGRRESKGGHAMLGIGMIYEANAWWVETVNSWSRKWGKQGICYLPRGYFAGDFNDAWAVRCTNFAAAA